MRYTISFGIHEGCWKCVSFKRAVKAFKVTEPALIAGCSPTRTDTVPAVNVGVRVFSIFFTFNTGV